MKLHRQRVIRPRGFAVEPQHIKEYALGSPSSPRNRLTALVCIVRDSTDGCLGSNPARGLPLWRQRQSFLNNPGLTGQDGDDAAGSAGAAVDLHG